MRETPKAYTTTCARRRSVIPELIALGMVKMVEMIFAAIAVNPNGQSAGKV